MPLFSHGEERKAATSRQRAYVCAVVPGHAQSAQPPTPLAKALKQLASRLLSMRVLRGDGVEPAEGELPFPVQQQPAEMGGGGCCSAEPSASRRLSLARKRKGGGLGRAIPIRGERVCLWLRGGHGSVSNTWWGGAASGSFLWQHEGATGKPWACFSPWAHGKEREHALGRGNLAQRGEGRNLYNNRCSPSFLSPGSVS